MNTPRRDPILDQAAEHLTAAAHHTDPYYARRAFDTGWRLALPTVTKVCRSEMRDPDTAQDAINHTALKLWVHLRGPNADTNGIPNQPTRRTIGGGAIRVGAKRTCLSLLKRNGRHPDDAGIPIDTLPTPETDTPDHAVRLEQLAQVAESPLYTKPLWARILRTLGDGHTRPADLAHTLGIPPGTIRHALWEIRHSDLHRHATGDHKVAFYTSLFDANAYTTDTCGVSA